MKKNILITGGLGHIGSAFLSSLKKNEFGKIIIIDNLLTQRFSSIFNKKNKINFQFYDYDISDDKIKSLFKEVDIVIHLAAITDATNSFNIAKEVKKINYFGSINIIKICHKYKCKLIFPSTTSVYGSQENILDESCPIKDLKPQSPYADYKLRIEKYLKNFSKKNNMHYIILRLGTIYGTSIGMRFHTAVNKFCWLASLNKNLTVWETALNQKRPYLGLNDAVRCFKFIIKKDLFDNEIYNVVSSNNTVNDIIKIIKIKLKNVQIKFVKTRIMNQLSYEILSDKIKKKGFFFRDNIKKGIFDTLHYLNSINNR